ncbi:MAG TPA: hypothetical protein VHL78_05485 [Actinomycetota bacterium]|nr:hypothetical protein [Actinomycetota bacterium]
METSQLVSIVGAAMVLGAFAGLQLRRMQPFGLVYLVLNVAGSVCLALAAGLEGLWAFVTLNTVWGLVSVRSLVVVVRGKAPATLAGRDAAAGVHDIPG